MLVILVYGVAYDNAVDIFLDFLKTLTILLLLLVC